MYDGSLQSRQSLQCRVVWAWWRYPSYRGKFHLFRYDFICLLLLKYEKSMLMSSSHIIPYWEPPEDFACNNCNNFAPRPSIIKSEQRKWISRRFKRISGTPRRRLEGKSYANFYEWIFFFLRPKLVTWLYRARRGAKRKTHFTERHLITINLCPWLLVLLNEIKEFPRTKNVTKPTIFFTLTSLA